MEMDDKERIIKRLFADENFKQSKWKPVRDFIDQYYDEIEQFMKRGGKLASLANIIKDETGFDVPIPTISVIKNQLKRKRLTNNNPIKPVVSTGRSNPAGNTSEGNRGENTGKKKWSDLQLRTSKNFVDVDIRDL